jgi:hypothetical protein
MQRELTSELANKNDLEVMSFRHFDCLLFERGEILKMFRPASRRVLMGTPSDRRVSGELLLVFKDDLKRLRPPSKRFDYSTPVFAAPIENFAGLILNSGLDRGSVDKMFIERVGQLLDALPSDRSGWEQIFGRDFLELPFLDRFTEVVHFLRKKVTFQDKIRDDIQFKVSIIEPPS